MAQSFHLLLLLLPLLRPGDCAYQYEEPLLYGHFPDNFLWGTATAAYQVDKLGGCLVSAWFVFEVSLLSWVASGGGRGTGGREGGQYLGYLH